MSGSKNEKELTPEEKRLVALGYSEDEVRRRYGKTNEQKPKEVWKRYVDHVNDASD